QRDIPRSAAAIDSDGIAHYNRMHTRMLNAGIYLPPSGYEVCFLSTVHTDEVLNEAAETIARIIGEEAHQWA
ncbi:MAG: hypothetical protein OEV80_15935, partial [candidate division Zixibacteria bacterium]|nr:hypothetical protein [candidate division Zixibacteria bacterium]